MDAVQDVNIGNLVVTWQKTLQAVDEVRQSQGKTTLALSAFHLSTLPGSYARRSVINEIYHSGADVIVGHIISVLGLKTDWLDASGAH